MIHDQCPLPVYFSQIPIIISIFFTSQDNPKKINPFLSYGHEWNKINLNMDIIPTHQLDHWCVCGLDSFASSERP